MVAIDKNGEIIQLDSNLISQFLPLAMEKKSIDILGSIQVSKKEYQLGPHRFDLLLRDKHGNEIICELKSTTRVTDGTACFPDAVSSRALKHLEYLIELTQTGQRTMIIFAVYREANDFLPCVEIDPKFSESFWRAKDAGVKIHVFQFRTEIIEKRGKLYLIVSFVRTIPLTVLPSSLD